MEDKILDVEGAARFLKISKDTVRNLARKYQIPHKRVGRQYRFHEDALDEFIRSGVSPEDFTLRDN